ncbi:hypothetical protein BH23PLA1_BH23PLA1_14750 [soil metagenome]
MSFRGVFIAIFLGMAMLVGAFLINRYRPAVEVRRPTPELVRATGKCAECHREETGAVVHEFEMSRHSAVGLNCLDCHQPVKGQETLAHKGFEINRKVTAANCSGCHQEPYEQYLKSRHAAPAWAAVTGSADFTPEQIAFAEQFHPGAVDRDPHALVDIQGPAAITKGCQKCHDVGKPNLDGSIGNCTSCHARHASSIELARTPETCGQCHMGPDHSQIEIYNESKHGILFHAQRDRMDLTVKPSEFSVEHAPVPTCTTCHMSGIGKRLESTHDTSERLSYYLFADVSDRRPNYRSAQANMKAACMECHTSPRIQQFYREAEAVVRSTNEFIKDAQKIMNDLREEGLLTPEPFDEPIEFVYFDLWHYYGRTAKHGAFMGGADFVQWHGFYEIVAKTVELKKMAEQLRQGRARAADVE